jgi:hypothetical protein
LACQLTNHLSCDRLNILWSAPPSCAPFRPAVRHRSRGVEAGGASLSSAKEAAIESAYSACEKWRGGGGGRGQRSSIATEKRRLITSWPVLAVREWPPPQRRPRPQPSSASAKKTRAHASGKSFEKKRGIVCRP